MHDTTDYVSVPRTVIESILNVRDSILPDDSPAQWREPLLGAVDSLRPWLTSVEVRPYSELRGRLNKGPKGSAE